MKNESIEQPGRWVNPIVQEIHRIREEIAAEYGNDLKAICRAARAKQDEHPERVVSYPPKGTRSKGSNSE